MAHLVERQFLLRANNALVLGLIGGGLAACAVAAIVIDVARWVAW
jgi:hypothetical protein